MSFWDHLEEFRSRLIKIVIVVGVMTLLSFWTADWMLAWLLKLAPAQNQSLVSLQPASVFVQSMRLSLISGVVLAFPILLYQLWAFISPGLSQKEVKVFIIALYGGTCLFILGLLFAYFFVIPTALSFFWDYSKSLGIQPTWTIDHYINFVLMFLLSFGLAFELPIILILLVRLKIISAKSLSEKRPYIIVVLAIVAAILTPPDVVSQVMLLIPLWLLYEISVFISKRFA